MSILATAVRRDVVFEAAWLGTTTVCIVLCCVLTASISAWRAAYIISFFLFFVKLEEVPLPACLSVYTYSITRSFVVFRLLRLICNNFTCFQCGVVRLRTYVVVTWELG